MVYRAREVRTGHRVILKAYDPARLTPNKRSNLERHVRALKAAVHLLGPHGGAVALERVVENATGTYLVMQACNGEAPLTLALVCRLVVLAPACTPPAEALPCCDRKICRFFMGNVAMLLLLVTLASCTCTSLVGFGKEQQHTWCLG